MSFCQLLLRLNIIQFYRYQVIAQVSATSVRGLFLDYGNTEDVRLEDIRPLPASQPQRRSQPQQRPNVSVSIQYIVCI